MKEKLTKGSWQEWLEKVKLSGASTFKGGVHPYDGKELSRDLPIADYMDPQEDMVFPMLQHLGAPCKPLVKKGDRVLRDQMIGEPTGLGAPVFSSVSGTVKDVKAVLHPNGNMVMSVIVQNDHLYETADKPYAPCSYKELTREEILERIRFAGIVGMGGAGFPTAIKLNPGPSKKIDYVLINGAECEPYLTSDYRVMLEDPWRVVNGLHIALSLFDDAKGLICIENNKPKAINTLKEYVADDENIKVLPIKTKYPQGSEKQLIYAATKREVPSGKLPADVGVVVMNIDTAVAVSRAITQGRPLQRRIVTITGDCVKVPRNYRVRIGTSMRELLEHTSELVKEPVKIISGGPMMGMTLSTLDVPIVKTSSCILLLSKDSAPMQEESTCIRCGKCISACPMHLQPYALNQKIENRDFAGFEAMKGMNCIECGACQFICPAKRKLTQTFRLGKKMVNMDRAAKKAAAAAKAAEEAKKEEGTKA